jgi:hypothetical protein
VVGWRVEKVRETKDTSKYEGTNGEVLYIRAMGTGRGNMGQLHGM